MRNHNCRGKTISIAYSESVFVALVTQHAERMRRIILSSLVRLAVPIFPHCLLNGTLFGEKSKVSMKYVFLILYKFYLKHFSF